MTKRYKVRTINGVKHRKPLKSPYRIKANKKKKDRLQAAGLLERITKRNKACKAFGETELRIFTGPVAKWIKFHYNTGKHYKIAGGSMRRKATRRQQYTNYDNVESISRVRNSTFNEVLDRNYCAFTDPKFGKHSPATINYLNKQAQHLESDTSPLGKELHKSTTRVLEKLSKNEQK